MTTTSSTNAHGTSAPVTRISDPDLLSSIIENLPISVWVKNDQSQFVLSNRQHGELTCVPENELLGQTVERLLGYQRGATARMRDIGVLSSGEESRYEQLMQFPRSPDRMVEVRKVRLKGSDGKYYILGVNFDMTEQRRHETQLRIIAESAPFGIVQIEEGGNVSFANAQALRLLGLSGTGEADVLGQIPAIIGQSQAGFPGKAGKFEVSLTQGAARKRLIVVSSGWNHLMHGAKRAANISIIDPVAMMDLCSATP